VGRRGGDPEEDLKGNEKKKKKTRDQIQKEPQKCKLKKKRGGPSAGREKGKRQRCWISPSLISGGENEAYKG